MTPYYINKQVKAKPMTFGEFSEYASVSYKEGYCCADDSEGYMVEHLEALPNANGHSGGIRWVPKDEFEFTHKHLGEHVHLNASQLRVVAEYDQLMVRLTSLNNWLKTDSLQYLRLRDRELLLDQSRLMTKLSFVLDERVRRMVVKPK